MNVTVSFDLGTYSPVTRTFTLHSLPPKNLPPVIKLLSPTNGSLIAAGTSIDLSVTDDGTIAASGYSVDGAPYIALSSPWKIGTSGWLDGIRHVSVFAVDDRGANVSLKLVFELDATAPALTIVSPSNGSTVPTGSRLVVSVSDSHLAQINFSLDSGKPVILPSPYTWDMTPWSLGSHVVQVRACDSVGHVSTASAAFVIADNKVTISVKSPASGSVVKPGISIIIGIVSSGAVTCSWSESGVTHSLPAPYQISTTGWSEGDHRVTISASNNLGGQAQIVYGITVDNTPPTMTLVSPSIGSYVTPEAFVNITAVDPHFKSISWTVSGFTGNSTQSSIAISLATVTADGPLVVTVTSSDSANNTVIQQFAFNMDCSCPRIWFTGASDGGLIAPGDLVSVNASDAYLAQVFLSVDSSGELAVSAPYQIDTTQLASGWHVLEGFATDLVGHMTRVQLSVYVDGTPPTVTMQSGTYFQNGSSFSVNANVSDDFGVRGVTLYYTLPSGGVASVPMSVEGANFEATLPADQLWSGMTTYVVASDVVGNEVEGVHQTLREVVSPPAGVGDRGSNGGSYMSASGAQSEAFLVALALSFALIIVTPSIRRKNSRDGRGNRRKHARLGTVDGIVSSISLDRAKPSTHGTSTRRASLPRAILAAPTSVHPADGKVRPSESPASKAVSLLDAIPELSIREKDAREDEVDAFQTQIEDLQRTIVRTLSARSVYDILKSPVAAQTDLEAAPEAHRGRNSHDFIG